MTDIYTGYEGRDRVDVDTSRYYRDAPREVDVDAQIDEDLDRLYEDREQGE